MSSNRTLLELRAEFGSSRMLELPIAGTIAWTVAGVLGAMLPAGGRFWITLAAAGLNSAYWRLPPVSPVYEVLVVATVALASSSVFLHVRVLRAGSFTGRRIGRRVDWLVMAAAILILVTVFIQVSGLRRSWGLP